MSKLFHPTKEGYDFYSTAPLSDFLGKNLSDFSVQETKDTCEINEELFLKEVNTKSVMLPAHITGKLSLQAPPTSALTLALSVNGVVQGMTKAEEDSGKERGFAFFVPETSFRDGENDVEVFEVSRGVQETPLLRRTRRLKVEGFELVRNEQGTEVLRSENSVVVPIVPRKVEGALDSAQVREGRVIFSGWAGDIGRKELADRVLLFANGKFIDSHQKSVTRKDVARLFGDWAETSGFVVEIPASRLAPDAHTVARFFALSKQGYASELQYFSSYQWGPGRR